MNQADLLQKADRVIEAAKHRQSSAVLWKYTDPDGNVFYLTRKEIGQIKSPYTGKAFPGKPERDNLSEVSKSLKEK
jgi:hypothetical protein